MMADLTFPRRITDELIHSLHERVLREDVAALNELAACLLRILVPRLRRAYRHASTDFVSDACEDAILEYAINPWRFDSTRGVALARFVQLAAARNLRNLMQAERRRRNREARYANEQSRASTNAVDGRYFDTRRVVNSVAAGGAERKALTAWLDGERDTARLATLLKLSHLALSEQRSEVKRFKDRMIKRLSRIVPRPKKGSLAK